MIKNARHSSIEANKKVVSNSKLFNKLLYLLVLTSIITSLSMAKFQNTYTPSGKAAIANWSIKVNTQDITLDGTEENKQITLVPEESENVVSGKLAPGYGGYFDITLDPTGTEVGFDYTLKLDMSNLPTDITITEYDIIKNSITSESDLIINNNKIEGEFELSDNESFSSENITTFRIYWVWNDVRENDAVHTATAIGNGEYSVGVSVCVTQKVV